MPPEKKHPYSTPAREQHPVDVVKEWPSKVTPGKTPLPSKSTKKSPAK